MKFGFSVIVDVDSQDDLQLIAAALDGLPVEQVRSIVLSPARPLQATPQTATGYTADLVLLDEVQVGQRAYGLVYDDRATHGNHPFRDGTQVNTSRVVSYEGDVLITENSSYRVIQEPTDGEATKAD